MTQPIDTEAATEAFLRLIETIKTLKNPGGCAWDAKQSPQSLRRYFMEEVCEVLEALDNEDAGRLEEELGDIMIHVLFQTDIAERSGEFSFAASPTARLKSSVAVTPTYLVTSKTELPKRSRPVGKRSNARNPNATQS